MHTDLIKRQIQYLKDCYTLDNASFTIQNFFDDKFEHQYLIETEEEELLNQAYPKTFIPDNIAEPIEQVLVLNSEDKELLYCSLFICGNQLSKFSKRLSTVVSPLIYSHASLEKTDGDYFISVKSTPQLNIGFLKTLEFQTDFEQCRMELQNCLSHGVIDFRVVGEIKSVLDKHVLNIHTDEVVIYPNIISKEERKKGFKPAALKKQDALKLVSCSGVLVSSKANNTEAVDRELQHIIKNNAFSQALTAYLGGQDIPKPIKKTRYTPGIPMVLNQRQEQVLINANTYPSSVIIGPPGTGKSFTITALAMDLIRQGKTVLIATKTDRALQVIEEKLVDVKLEERFVKIGGKRYQQKIKRFIRTSLNGFIKTISDRDYNDVKKSFNHLVSILDELENEYIEHSDYIIHRSDELLEASGLFSRWLHFYHNNFNGKIGKEINQINSFYIEINRFILKAELFFQKTLDKQFQDTINSNKVTFSEFYQALNLNDQGLKLSKLNTLDFQTVLKAIPLWLTEIKSVSEFLPLHKNLFDVVIFDEATQCDMAACIPILQRGKKVIIAGDPNQLRHFSFISNEQVSNKLKEYDLYSHTHLNYRSNSMLDLMMHNTQYQDQTVALNEHYRSLPSIIEFSNARFYGNHLNIMTAFPNHNPSKTISTIQLNGKRSEQGVNDVEILKVVELVENIIKKNAEFANPLSIGILSPFRKQTEALTKTVAKTFSTQDIKRHNILIGTPHSFQGSERDIMILSLSIDDDFHHGSILYLNKEDMFNVAITRAKTRQIIIHSFTINNLPQNSLLKPYLEHINHPNKKQDTRPEALIKNTSYQEIQTFLKEQNWPFYMNHYLAGMTIDILFKYNDIYFAIDLIGFPGDEKEAFTMERYKILTRVGVKVFPLSFLTWSFNKTDVITKLKTFVSQVYTRSVYHEEPEEIQTF